VKSAGINMDRIQVFNLSGQQIYQNISLSSKDFLDAKLIVRDQVLIVKIVFENGESVSKKILVQE
jgi:hypothetical protein